MRFYINILLLFIINKRMKKQALILLSICIFGCLTYEITIQPKDKDEEKPFDIKAAHKIFMLYGWTIVADLIIIIAFYQYRKYAKVIHAIVGTAISITTLVTSLPSLLKNGFNTKHLTHYIMGVVVYGMMGSQLLMGFIKFVMVFFNKGNPIALYVMKVIHKWLGYILLILSKVQVFLILKKDRPEYSYLLGWQCAVLFILLYRYFTFPKLEEVISVDINPKKKIKNISELKMENKGVVIFGNLVYDVTPLKDKHPAGFKIIEGVVNKSIDKYLYGMYSSEDYLKITRYSHSAASMKLMEKPLAKISIHSPFEGFDSDVVSVKVNEIVEILKNLYQIKLIKSQGFNFVYKGYTSPQQIGRYYSLTIDKKITRLYTSVNFLAKTNKDLLHQIYFYKNGINVNYGNLQVADQNSLYETINDQEDGSQLSLLIKQYKNGQFTKDLLNMKDKILQLSSERGQGLELQNLIEGRVIVVAGGTGLFPFCDLIDLLFKDALLYKVEPSEAVALLKGDPILNLKPFEKLNFEFMGSFDRIQDIPKITLHQILYLIKDSHKFKFLFRLNHNPSEYLTINHRIQQTKQRFEVILSQQIQKQSLSKVWICGPPRMNASLKKILSKYLSLSQYEIF